MRRAAGSRQKGVCFYFFGAEKNQHAPALHLLNMRHAATQTRPGVCRIHFHLRHLIVSRRSPCSRGCSDKSAVHVWRASACGGHRWPTRWVEWISRPRLRQFRFPRVYRHPFCTVLRRVPGRRWKWMCFRISRCVGVAQTCAAAGLLLEWNDMKRRERVNRATLHSLLSSTSDRW